MDYLFLVISLGTILLGALVFTNGLEWFGHKMNFSDGCVGSIFAAVGTALPETLIPIIAILFGSKAAGAEIGIGAILGAPFMLATLAFFITGLTCFFMRKKRDDYPNMRVHSVTISRDLFYFLTVYAVAILAAFIPVYAVKVFVSIGLVGAYVLYVYRTFTCQHANECACEEPELDPLFFARKNPDPALSSVVFQTLAGLALIVGSAWVFVHEVETVSVALGISAFILSLIIAPIATELPEKINSVIWVMKGKDTLALGNITGAMVFQSSIIPAIGILLTDWQLGKAGFLTAALAIGSAGLAALQMRRRKTLTPAVLLAGGAFYLIFIADVAFMR